MALKKFRQIRGSQRCSRRSLYARRSAKFTKVFKKVALSTEVREIHDKDSIHTVHRKASTKVIDDNDTITDEQLKSHMNRRGRECTKVKERTDGSNANLNNSILEIRPIPMLGTSQVAQKPRPRQGQRIHQTQLPIDGIHERRVKRRPN